MAMVMAVLHFVKAEDVLNILFMADIGHSRQHAVDLTKPWPMGKSAYEGAFSLYEGLEDFIVNQGAKPTAALIVGDVAYGGGSQLVNNATRDAFQTYLHGQVPVDRVYPVMGNHDIHYLGCSKGEVLTPWLPCYYGTARTAVLSSYEMTFQQWRQNWMMAYPGLEQATLPAKEGEQWLAPLRYNLNLDNRSSVYLIVGLISGVYRTTWNNDTPPVAMDGMGEGGDALECRFLHESLQEGRRQKKSIFVYLTHHFQKACKDWNLISQLDVWITGHKHLFWQSEASGAEMAQELRHFPLRILIGNGGFDEGQDKVVSFGHLREIPYMDGETERVKVHFDIYDTCISGDLLCPSIGIGGPYCWDKCQAMPGGVDGGGGPRKATAGLHSHGFTYDAPRFLPGQRPWLFSKARLLKLGNEDKWLSVGKCPFSELDNCLVPGRKDQAIPVQLFGRGGKLPPKDGPIEAGLALQDSRRSFVVHDTENVMHQGFGFWTPDMWGRGKMNSDDADLFTFVSKDGSWTIKGVTWKETDDDEEYLAFDSSEVMDVLFEENMVYV